MSTDSAKLVSELRNMADSQFGPNNTQRETLWAAATLIERHASDAGEAVCEFCGGSGERMMLVDDGPEARTDLCTCPNCSGTGNPTAPASDGLPEEITVVSGYHWWCAEREGDHYRTLDPAYPASTSDGGELTKAFSTIVDECANCTRLRLSVYISEEQIAVMRKAAALLTAEGETAAASEAQLDALICDHCGADRLKTGCALRNIGDCKFIGKPQSAARPTAAQERKAVAWCSQNDIDLMLHMRTVEPEYGDFQITVTPSREDGRTIAIYTDPVNISGVDEYQQVGEVVRWDTPHGKTTSVSGIHVANLPHGTKLYAKVAAIGQKEGK